MSIPTSLRSLSSMKIAYLLEKKSNNSLPGEEENTNTIKKRITNLEIDNANLSNFVESLKGQLEESDHKIKMLEKQINTFKLSVLNDVKEEVEAFKNTIRKEFLQLRRKNNSPTVSSFRKLAMRNMLANKPSRFKNENEIDKCETVASEDEELQCISLPGCRSPRLNKSYSAAGPYLSMQSFSDFKTENSSSDNEEKSCPQIGLNFPYPEDDTTKGERKSSPANLSPSKRKKTFFRSQSRSLGEFDSDSEVFKPNRMFENFLIIGSSKEKAKEISSSSLTPAGGQALSLDTEIIFNFAESSDVEKRLTPMGVEHILASAHIPLIEYKDESEIDQVFSNIALEAGDEQKKFLFPLEPHVVKNKWAKDVEAINPQHKLYAICIRKKDFFICNSELNAHNHLYQTETVYAFLTYYPIPEVFFNFLSSILSIIKTKRREVYWSSGEKGKSDIDFGALDVTFLQDVINYLKSLENLDVPSPFRSLKYIVYPDDHIKSETKATEYKCPVRSHAYFELASWNVAKTFSMFSFDNIRLLLSAILLEKSVVIISSNITLLSSTINSLLGLLFPFKYSCPIIPNLPSDCMEMCRPPFPVIIGINREETCFWDDELMNDCESIFVFLDSKIIYIDEKNNNIAKFPVLEFGCKDLKNLYSKVNSTGTKFEVVTHTRSLSETFKHKNKKEKSLSHIDQTAHPIIPDNYPSIYQIFSYMRSWVESNLLKYIPPLQNNHEDGWMKKLIHNNDNVRRFFKVFKTTMSFNNYPESVSFAYKE